MNRKLSKVIPLRLNVLSLFVILLSSWSCSPLGRITTYIHSRPNTIDQMSQSPPKVELLAESEQENYPQIQLDPTIELEELDESVVLENLIQSVQLADTEELTIAEPEETVTQEVEDLEQLGSWTEIEIKEPSNQVVKYDFPITINRQVEYYLDFFQNRNCKSFKRWLSRSGRYVPMIQEKLHKAGLPLDLAYLPMIESGYSLTAFSKARAVGPWQFIRPTAISFGLKVNNYVDERRDPLKSTDAAITFLKELYQEFGSWELAVAGYNAGEGKIRRAIKKYGTHNFWKLAEYRYLRSETKRYVPKLIAAIIIAKSPEQYGFTNIQYEAPLEFEYATVARWTSLQTVAVAIDAEIEQIYNLNRELRKRITPPDQKYYSIKIPPGTAKTLASNLARIHPTVKTGYKTHIVGKNESINQICKKYNINKTTLLKANNLRKSKLVPGKRLRIPYQMTTYALLSEKELQNTVRAKGNNNFFIHTVNQGETLSQIANAYNITPKLIASWNSLSSIHNIKVGQNLALFMSHNKQVNGTKQQTASAPFLKVPQQTITLSGSAKNIPSKAHNLKYYKVKGGDSLWTIAKKFNINAEDIKDWNRLKSNTIHPGLRLLLKLNDTIKDV